MTDPNQLYERGVALYNKGEVAGAKRALHEASQASHHAAALELGSILYDEGDLNKAADEWQFAAGSSDQEIAAAAVINYGRMIGTHEFNTETRRITSSRGALIGGRDLAEAEELWLAAANSDHRDAAWAWIGLGRLREDPAEREAVPDPQGAEEAFDAAARSAHSESRAYALFKLGRIRWKLGKNEEAKATLDVGATSEDNDWAPWCAFELGRLFWSEGEDHLAAHWWQQAAAAGHPDISDSAEEALNDPGSNWRRR